MCLAIIGFIGFFLLLQGLEVFKGLKWFTAFSRAREVSSDAGCVGFGILAESVPFNVRLAHWRLRRGILRASCTYLEVPGTCK